MDPVLAMLVLVSAGLHPLWNALIKSDPRPEGAFLGVMVLLALLGGAHSVVAGYDLLAARHVWPLIAASWAGVTVYATCMVITLRRGDLSAYYPIIRSSPLFIVVAGVLFLGERYGGSLLTGIALVLVGAFFLQYRRGARLLDDPGTLALAVLAMAGTGIYSIADSRAMRVLEPPVMLFWVQVLCLPSYVLVFRARGRSAPGWSALFLWTKRPLRTLGIGLMCYVSYYLILWAYGHGGDVAAVTSVRQASIPFSVLIGGLWLKEPDMPRRLFASLILAAGIVVIVVAG